jgi:hypothetical protein
MKLALMTAALLLALQPEAGAAAPMGMQPHMAPAQIPPPPVPLPPLPPAAQAQAERLLAHLPKEQWVARSTTPDPEKVKRLVALNPGKEALIATILSTFATCSEPAAPVGRNRAHRIGAESLARFSPEKIEGLIAFFDGPDFASFEALEGRIKNSATPAAADLAEWERLMAAYPIGDLGVALFQATVAATNEGAFNALRKCASDMTTGLVEAGIEPLEGSLFSP